MVMLDVTGNFEDLTKRIDTLERQLLRDNKTLHEQIRMLRRALYALRHSEHNSYAFADKALRATAETLEGDK